MNKKPLFTVGIVALVIVIAGVILVGGKDEMPAPASVSDNLVPQGDEPMVREGKNAVAEEHVITYTDEGFSLRAVEIKQGELSLIHI